MKTKLTFIGLLFFFCNGKINAQTPELWSMAQMGGTSNKGAIFKMDLNGMNYTRPYDFPLDYPGGNPEYNSLCQASNGKLYGMTYSTGILFSFDPNSGIYLKLFQFGGNNGSGPYGSLIEASNGKLYGMTHDGGFTGVGVLFSFDPNNNIYTKLYEFGSTSFGGIRPYGSLIQNSNGMLYGMTSDGGNVSKGTIFSFNIGSNFYATVHDFDGINGEAPFGDLTHASNGNLYGMTRYGGTNNGGVLFSFDIATTSYVKLFDLDSTFGWNPIGSLVQATNSNLYGMTLGGGTYDFGVIFSYDINTGTYSKINDFDLINGGLPTSSLIQASNGKLYGEARGGINDAGVLFSFDLTNNGYTKLIDFDIYNSAGAYGSLMQAFNGNLYGMTRYGGMNNFGVLFSYDINTIGYTKLFDFNSTVNGAQPSGSLIRASNGKLYGMTPDGGINNSGVLFSFDINSNLYSKLFDFELTTGAYPYGSLIQASNGKLFGMTHDGGSQNYGVIFSYDLILNSYIKLFDFDSIIGAYPYGNLMQASNGKLYGMTSGGGTIGTGVLFEYDINNNTYTKLFDFYGNNGAGPYGSLIQATNGKLYGMGSWGGVNGSGGIFSFDINTGTYTNLHSFYPYWGGFRNSGSLIQATNGKLYGMTTQSTIDVGEIFSFDLWSNTFTHLYSFQGGITGAYPQGSLMEASNGKLYGMDGLNGIIFNFDTATNTFQGLRIFIPPDAINPLYSSFIEIVSPTNINESSSPPNEINIYPNPFNSSATLTINSRFTMHDIQLEIYDIAGREISKYELRNQQTVISRENLSSGIYFYKVQNDNEIIGSGKLIIQ